VTCLLQATTARSRSRRRPDEQDKGVRPRVGSDDEGEHSRIEDCITQNAMDSYPVAAKLATDLCSESCWNLYREPRRRLH